MTQWRRKRKRANGAQLAKRFIARLEQGVLIDRTVPINIDKPVTVKAPSSLRLSTSQPTHFQEEP